MPKSNYMLFTSDGNLIRIPMGQPRKGGWTRSEHERFLDAIERDRNAKWADIARAVGKTKKQVESHAQKYRKRIQRHCNGNRASVRRVRCPPRSNAAGGNHLGTNESLLRPSIDSTLRHSSQDLSAPEDNASDLNSHSDSTRTQLLDPIRMNETPPCFTNEEIYELRHMLVDFGDSDSTIHSDSD